LAPVHNHQQDGFMQQSVPTARALYHPNSIQGNEPRPAAPERGFAHLAERLAGNKTRERSDSFNDHFTQARMFLDSQSPAERQHLIDACRFEVGKVQRLGIRQRVIARFAEIDPDLAREVAPAVGVSLDVPPPPLPPGVRSPVSVKRKNVAPSPALSLANQPKDSIKTRKIAVLIGPGVRTIDVEQARRDLGARGATLEFVSHALGPVPTDAGEPLDASKTWLQASSVLYDAVYVPGGAESVASLLTLGDLGDPLHFVREAFRHSKPIAASNEGVELLAAAQLPDIQLAEEGQAKAIDSLGVVTAWGEALESFTKRFVAAIRAHRHFEREQPRVPV
jgi:catalase